MTCLVPYAASILIAMQISCVPQDEFGKMGAARSALVKILPVLFNFLYVKIWDMTSMSFPGGIYILSGGIASVALGPEYVQIISLKKTCLQRKLRQTNDLSIG